VIAIAEERAEHHAAVADLLRTAFGGDDEVALVAQLRRDGDAALALVALSDGAVAGHILFSPLQITAGGGSIRAVALAPLAVTPTLQRQGIGARLIAEAHERLRAAGYAASFVLGHPEYYARFGYSAEIARRFRSPYDGPAFMALELTGGALAGRDGTVSYAGAFAAL
jgi:putative acetyltransferase